MTRSPASSSLYCLTNGWFQWRKNFEDVGVRNDERNASLIVYDRTKYKSAPLKRMAAGKRFHGRSQKDGSTFRTNIGEYDK
ncbi:hypothetical protein L3Y34_019431 [Caenorhabditis briggsae]|uniref:Uncharacterized protein n=1 Tax=Caenorhabditis briggsae TaxID=6238 RepID=A0AAE9IW36_CAEBR|nr:hypothetical protein L3Y34_019431 [Caenorhabditis briggsae]